MLIRWIITSIARTAGLTMMLFILVGSYGDLKAKDCSRRDAIFYKITIGISIIGIFALNGV